MAFYLTIVLSLSVTCTVTVVVGHSTGAPTSACTTITPSHGNSTATSLFPYIVNISSLDGGYIPGQNYTIVLSGSSDNADFLGFLVQGRVMADGTTATGTFTDNGDDQQAVCTDDTAITHVDKTAKTSVQLAWIAPPTGTGTILFRYAFVDAYDKYWSNQATGTVSEVINDTEATIATTNTIISTVETSSTNIVATLSTALDNGMSSTMTADLTITPSSADGMATSSTTTAADATTTSPRPTATAGVSATPTVEATPAGGATGTMAAAASSLMILLLTSIIILIN